MLSGGEGDDTLNSGEGGGFLSGGAGNDTFVFDATSGTGLGTNTISDWNTGDKLDFSGLITDSATTLAALVAKDAVDIFFFIGGNQQPAGTRITIHANVTGGSEDTRIFVTGLEYIGEAATATALDNSGGVIL
ncbi:hypothetical protein MNB_SUP05-SYMBIONT-5-677 [hydrothermal vent metagenome]|uniref:Uncharacterized protein n=1 Tax=hydrothermal vent metagenome TaxID=652676 RepID=A0A1W1E5D8_9ZZZZ